MASIPDSLAPKSADFAAAKPPPRKAPFGQDLTEGQLDELLAGPFLEQVDPTRFGPPRTLRDILRREARAVVFEDGDIVVREGDYGGSVFVILEGRLRALLDPKGSRHIAGRVSTGKLGWIASFRAVRGRSKIPEERRENAFLEKADVALRQVDADTARTFVRDVEKVVERYDTAPMEAGQVFGEIAALSRSPRTATVFAEGRATVLELRWQGLRELRKRDPGFRARLDELYRSRNFMSQLRQTPIFDGLGDEALQALAAAAAFESYGEYEWFRAFRKVEQEDAAEVLELETMVAEEGTELRDLILVRSGFARISRRHDHGHWTVGYLRPNEVFGLDEILAHARGDGDLRLRASLRAVGYVDILRFPVPMVEKWVVPALAAGSLPRPAPVPETPMGEILQEGGFDQPLLDFVVDRRIVNGTAAMLINADRCVACDACVEACALAHDGNPRFLRTGPMHAQLQFASACLHCVDPVCLIGCPTGAIQRSLEGPVIIEQKTCIGCGTCASSCPYDTIRMVQVRDAAGAPMVEETQRRPILEATKCDLCSAHPGGPACAQACPHDALIRIDLKDRSRLADWVEGTGRLRRMGWAIALTALLVAGAWELRNWATDALDHPDRASGWMLLLTVLFLVLLAVRKSLPTLPLGRVFRWTEVSHLRGVLRAGSLRDPRRSGAAARPPGEASLADLHGGRRQRDRRPRPVPLASAPDAAPRGAAPARAHPAVPPRAGGEGGTARPAVGGGDRFVDPRRLPRGSPGPLLRAAAQRVLPPGGVPPPAVAARGRDSAPGALPRPPRAGAARPDRRMRGGQGQPRLPGDPAASPARLALSPSPRYLGPDPVDPDPRRARLRLRELMP